MSCGPEFDLIERLFGQPQTAGPATPGMAALQHPAALGIGDDAALLAPLPAGEQLVFASDLLVEGRHYFPEVDPRSLGHKLLAVNLSDLAAMGARPLAYTLSMAIRRSRVAAPEQDPRARWLVELAAGLRGLADETGCALVGGDTVGLPDDQPETFSLAVLGTVPVGHALRRDGLVVGDQLWVSGHLGDGAWGVRHRVINQRLGWPMPRLGLGERLRGLAHAAIDISDGLSSELLHLGRASARRLGQSLVLQVRLDALQACLGPAIRAAVDQGEPGLLEACRQAADSGDEYELCFSAPAQAGPALAALSADLGLPLTCIGEVCADAATATATAAGASARLVWRGPDNQRLPTDQCPSGGFDHFRAEVSGG